MRIVQGLAFDDDDGVDNLIHILIGDFDGTIRHYEGSIVLFQSE
ncbi:hypothetical protein [Halostagnicola bangensis]